MDNRIPQDLFDELRLDLLRWALLPLILIGLAVAPLPDDSPHSTLFLGGMICLTLALGVWWLSTRHRVPAAWLFCLGLVGLALLASQWFPRFSLPVALVFPIVAASLVLGPWECLSIAVLSSAVLVTGFPNALGLARPPSLTLDVVLLWTIAFLGFVSQRPQVQVISWAWRGYQDAQRHLDMARDRQVQLKQALDDLALANRQTVRLNEMLITARQAVEQARQSKDEFVANVSHELRTPLNMIIGFSDMILEAPQVYSRRLPPALLADVAAIKRNSEHLASLVDDVLDLAEADSGYTQLAQQPSSIAEILREATEAVQVLFDQKHLSLELDVPSDLPPIMCDRRRIRQVVLNLLSNAGRMTEQGGVCVSAQQADGSLVVTVADTGPGINPRLLSHVFDPFQHDGAPPPSEKGGSGLGLSISKRFVELHGGKIWLESSVGQGTRASFSLPITSDLADEEMMRWFNPYQEYTPRSRPSMAGDVSALPRVVILERCEALLRLVMRGQESIEAVAVRTMAELPAAIEANAPVALIINEAPYAAAAVPEGDQEPFDLRTLPHMDLDIPIITCWVPERSSTVDGIGDADFLAKPVTRSQMLERIEKVAPDARSVLLVDDDPQARQLFGRMLSSLRRDLVILDAEDGETALKLLVERRPDLLVLDLVMPNKDGFAVLEEKAADERICDIPTIIVSAWDPVRGPIVSRSMSVTRQDGLSTRDLNLAVQAVARALQPRFGSVGGRSMPESDDEVGQGG
ncbi:MAG: ATP-binding protein [Anaerolineae bacterium]